MLYRCNVWLDYVKRFLSQNSSSHIHFKQYYNIFNKVVLIYNNPLWQYIDIKNSETINNLLWKMNISESSNKVVESDDTMISVFTLSVKVKWIYLLFMYTYVYS